VIVAASFIEGGEVAEPSGGPELPRALEAALHLPAKPIPLRPIRWASRDGQSPGNSSVVRGWQ